MAAALNCITSINRKQLRLGSPVHLSRPGTRKYPTFSTHTRRHQHRNPLATSGLELAYRLYSRLRITHTLSAELPEYTERSVIGSHH